MNAFLAAAVTIVACADSAAKTPDSPIQGATSHTLRVEQVGDRFNNPVYLASPPGDSRLFIVEQPGEFA